MICLVHSPHGQSRRAALPTGISKGFSFSRSLPISTAVDNSCSCLTFWENQHVGNVDVIRSRARPDNLLCDVFSDEGLDVLVHCCSFRRVASEADDAELGFDHARANLRHANWRGDELAQERSVEGSDGMLWERRRREICQRCARTMTNPRPSLVAQ